jgi:16S rRNA (uracil1498-N3)-methyltransferase
VDSPARAGAAAQVFVDDLEALDLADADRHHLGRVLRLRPGELVIAADGAGTWRCTTVRTGEPTVRLEATGPLVHEARATPPVSVAFAPVKGDRPEWTVQKLTELGVDRILPITTSRSVVRWEGPRAAKAVVRLRAIAREAAAQCRAVWLPEVAEARPLEELVCTEADTLALCVPGGPPPSLATPTLAVGPEGGWTDTELERAPATVGLGPTVLRAETAALSAGVLLTGLRAATVRSADGG